MEELGDAEHAAIVADALAFIDACGHESDSGALALRDSASGANVPSRVVPAYPVSDESTRSYSLNAPRLQRDQARGRPQRDRRSHALSPAHCSAARLRRKQRTYDAIRTLREDIAHLETQLALLRVLRDGGSQPLDPAAPCSLQSLQTPESLLDVLGGFREANRAALARYERQRAETTNRKLKEMLAVYADMSCRLENLFAKTISVHELKALFDIDALHVETVVRSAPVVSGGDLGAIFELHQELDRLHATAKAAFMSDIAQRERSFYKIRHDQTLGQVFEFQADTPMGCTFHQLEKYTRTFTTPYTQKPGQHRTETWTGRKTSYEKHLSLAFSSPQYGQFHLDGTTVFGVFEEARCSILVSVTRHVLRGSGLVVYERSWMLAADSQAGGRLANQTAVAAHFQTVYQAFAEKCETLPNEYPNQLREFILHTQLQRMRAHMLEMQIVMLHEPDVIEDQSKLASCLLVECPMKYMYSE